MHKLNVGGVSPRSRRALGGALLSFLCGALLLLSVSRPALAQQRGLPPLIDRELFFGDPEISGAQISPDGKFISFLKPLNGTRNIWVKRAAEPFSAAKPITNDTRRPILNYFWSRDGKFILFVQDKGGDENFNLYAVNPAEALAAAGQSVPAARNLTEAKNVRAIIYHVPRSEPDAIYVGLNDRDPAWHDLYKVQISTGERTPLRRNTERLTGWIFDNRDRLRLATRAAENGETEVLLVNSDSFKKIYSCGIFEECAPVEFNKDDRRVFMMTNKGDVDLIRLALFDTETGREEAVESDPLKRVDLGGTIFSEVTDELIATTYNDERRRIYWKDPSFEADYKLLQQRLPGKQVSFGSRTRDEQQWLVVASSDTEPGETHLFDRRTKNLTLQYRVRERLPREHLARVEAIRYKSSDGREIPAFLTLPQGVAARNLPLLVVPHGGPWARDFWGYSGFPQFFANRGYAVLQPNFRGSTGYGKDFINAGNLQWGDRMQDDITWGVKHLVAQGVADPKRVGIMGGSYGGYATLAGVTFTPDLYAAAVAIVAPSNLITLLQSIPPYWEAGRIIFHKRMGDPNTPEGRAQLVRQSPLTHAAKIKTPLLVVQGANDPRVNKRESDQIVIALRDRGFPVEYLVAPDEGHGFARPVNNMAMIATAERFLAKHLGGRYQAEMTPEVAQRLKEITVDVKTVEMPKRIEASGTGLPKLAASLQPGAANYKGSIAVGGQTIPISIKSEIKEENGAWVVTETAQLPNGEISDTATLDKTTLALVRRSIRQGPVTIDLAFADGKASGTMNTGGQQRPVSADTGGALFADGAGAHAVLASLPLVEGYTTTFRNFDVQKQRTRIMQLKVVGTETVTVPAGTFTAYNLEVTSEDGDKTNVWVDKQSRRVLKINSARAQSNGAVITVELTQ